MNKFVGVEGTLTSSFLEGWHQMPGKYQQLRREMQANFELTWAGQADSNGRIEEISTRLGQHANQIELQAARIEQQGQQIAKQGERIADQGQQIADQSRQIGAHGRLIGSSLRETARLGREVVAIGHQMTGRFRLMDDRFGKFLDVLEQEALEQRRDLDDLDRRVTVLENRQGPAA